MSETTETGTELALFPKLNLPSVTKIAEEMRQSFGTMYTRIEDGIAALPTDMSIKANREKRASYAYSISRTKTGLDEAAANVSSDAKQIVDVVNGERRQLKTTLDMLRDKARAPLDAWEAAEKARADRVAAKRQELISLPASCALMTADELFDAANFIDTPIGADEFGEDARMLIDLRDETRTKLFEMRREKQKAEAEAAELEQLRREKAEREEADRIKREQEEAEKQARMAEEKRLIDAENERIRQEDERARIAKEADERAAREAAEKIEAERREKEAAEQRAKEAEERAAKAAEDAKRREIEAQEQQKMAAARAEEEAQRREAAAKEDERQRIAREALAKERADQERAADEAHRRKINSEIIAAMMKAFDVNETFAKQLVVAIYKGQVPHIAISY